MENFDNWDEQVAFEVCQLVAEAVQNSSGFHSAWEFDMSADGKDLHDKLTVLLTQLGFLKVTEDD